MADRKCKREAIPLVLETTHISPLWSFSWLCKCKKKLPRRLGHTEAQMWPVLHWTGRVGQTKAWSWWCWSMWLVFECSAEAAGQAHSPSQVSLRAGAASRTAAAAHSSPPPQRKHRTLASHANRGAPTRESENNSCVSLSAPRGPFEAKMQD